MTPDSRLQCRARLEPVLAAGRRLLTDRATYQDIQCKPRALHTACTADELATRCRWKRRLHIGVVGRYIPGWRCIPSRRGRVVAERATHRATCRLQNQNHEDTTHAILLRAADPVTRATAACNDLWESLQSSCEVAWSPAARNLDFKGWRESNSGVYPDSPRRLNIRAALLSSATLSWRPNPLQIVPSMVRLLFEAEMSILGAPGFHTMSSRAVSPSSEATRALAGQIRP